LCSAGIPPSSRCCGQTDRSYAAIATGELEVVADTVEKVTGRPPVSLREYLRMAFPTG
jgi:hypothetical protein